MKRMTKTTSAAFDGLHSPKKASLETRRFLLAMLLLLPAMASLFIFKYVPFLLGIFASFFKLDIVNMPGEFVGFDNYIRAFKDARFFAAIGHNFKGFAYSLCMNFWVPIILAILINEVRKGRTVYRLLYFIPGCAPAIAMSIVWKFFWQPDYGLANYLVGLLGIPPQLWLNDANLVYFCMSFPGLIICGGMTLVVYLASLQNIPQELYEASVIDGANVVQRIRHITIPQISDTVFLMFTLSLIGAVNSMEGVMVLTGGGPSGSTETALLYAYNQGVRSMDYSYAMTMITLVFILVLVINVITTKMKNKEA